jgi:hypothetical protein
VVECELPGSQLQCGVVQVDGRLGRVVSVQSAERLLHQTRQRGDGVACHVSNEKGKTNQTKNENKSNQIKRTIQSITIQSNGKG